MRVVSLVPSWTETLLAAGVNVVGRTRFCIHPASSVAGIPVIGGTKNWDLSAIRALQPDLLILDQEENPKWMAEQTEIPYFASHVTDLHSVAKALAEMAVRLHSTSLSALAGRWRAVATWPGCPPWQVGDPIPGLIGWGREPEGAVRRVLYVIWRDPWMSVSQETFVGSVLKATGFAPYLADFPDKYPRFEMVDFPAGETLLLFSSEPYPFLRKKDVLGALELPYAFVDGECFSWFGVRSLRFLEGLRASRGDSNP
jgi:ABC-type Fe3+-hydroxamate transport system substrate-binding protein